MLILAAESPSATEYDGDIGGFSGCWRPADNGVLAMNKYLFVYHGGSRPLSEADAKKVMDAWGKWFGSLGGAVIDGGNPVGKSSTVKPDGALTSGGGANPASGYSLIEASSLEDAHKKALGCPLLAAGGTIEIAQAIDM
jgi:hypothetical protein